MNICSMYQIFHGDDEKPTAVDENLYHANSIDHETKRAEILAPGVNWTNLMSYILRRILRVATLERILS
jgi:hypothetical protein